MEQNQELMFKLSMYEQQIQQLQRQLQAVEQAIVDMGGLNLDLDDLIGSTGKEILAPIGRGIFAKTKLLSEDLIVDIGNRNFVKKTIPETKEILQAQIEKLKVARRELEGSLDKINEDLTKTMTEAQEQK